MNDIIIKLAKGEIVSDNVIAKGLTEICEDVHAHCDEDCPVYEVNGNKIPDSAKNFKVNRGCDCFKNGKNMLEFIRKTNK